MKTVAAGWLAVVLLVVVLVVYLVVGAAFWGWLIMLAAGGLGYTHLGFAQTFWAGMLLAFVVGGLAKK